MIYHIVLLVGMLLCSVCAQAESLSHSPTQAMIAPNKAMLSVEAELPLKDIGDGLAVFSFFLPPKATNFRMRVLGADLIKEEFLPKVLAPQSRLAQERCRLEKRLVEIAGENAVIEAKKRLWSSLPDQYTVEELERLEEKKGRFFGGIEAAIARLQQEKADIEGVLAHMPDTNRIGTEIVGTVVNVKGKTVRVLYTYTSTACGWKARYMFGIDPQKAMDQITVSLRADITQQSGIDWTNTKIVLVTGTEGRLQPNTLARWELEADEKPQAIMEKRVISVGSIQGMTAGSISPNAVRRASPERSTQGVFAEWLLPITTLWEGQSTVLIEEKVWKDPIFWLARPNRTKGEVYLMAKHSIPQGEVWPEGEASFSVAGQITGKSHFATKSGLVTLFFGRDPRVGFDVVQDARKQGESGFLGREKSVPIRRL